MAAPHVYLAGFAEELGVTSSHLSRIMRGKGNPSLQLAIRLANKLGMSIDELARAVGAQARSSECPQPK